MNRSGDRWLENCQNGLQDLRNFAIEIVNDGGPIGKLGGAKQNMFSLKSVCSVFGAIVY
jgi:hypothetical protein